MKRILIAGLAMISFMGCAPDHTLKEVVNNPNLILPSDDGPISDDNALGKMDKWIRDNMW